MKDTNVGIFIETFIRRIHDLNIDYKNKVIIDVGANFGDTAMLFARKGAIVYAFEPIRNNFDAMVNNIYLNRALGLRIYPIHAAIGEDKRRTFYYDPVPEYLSGGASAYVYYSSARTHETVDSYSLSKTCKKFEISDVDLLKMDAKGAEFLISEDELKNVNRIAIEYSIFGEHKLQDLLGVISRAGFDYCIFNHSFSEPIMLNQMWTRHGTVYAVKRGLKK